MQNLKCILVFCAAAVCAAPFALRAADPALQNKLQEALDKKLNEVQTQPAEVTPPPAVATPKPKKQRAAAPAPAVAPVAKKMSTAKKATPLPAAQPAPAPTVKAEPAPAPTLVAQAEPGGVLNMPPAADPQLIRRRVKPCSRR